jgi:aspartate/methionine/tyrosine aminotransferase
MSYGCSETKERRYRKARGHIDYRRTAIETESPEQFGYGEIAYNLAESSVTDVVSGDVVFDLENLVLCYGDHLGNPRLRECIAGEAEVLSSDDVLITAGAAAALFIVNTSLLRPGDHAIVAHPNYVTNIETPRAIGAQIEFLPLTFENQWCLDVKRLAEMIRPETQLVSLTSPHNPTGAVMSEQDLQQVIALVEAQGCYLLFDETYRDMLFDAAPLLAAALSPRAISISSLSKTYGLPGIRIGWLITRDNELMETFLAAKEQIFICGSVVDEEIACQFLTGKEDYLPKIKIHVQRGFDTVQAWMRTNHHLEWVEPACGVVCFPRIRAHRNVDLDAFYDLLVNKYKTFVGPGHWFEMDRRYMRIGFGWPAPGELQGGLECIANALEESII